MKYSEIGRTAREKDDVISNAKWQVITSVEFNYILTLLHKKWNLFPVRF